jgi:hypothetical protein
VGLDIHQEPRLLGHPLCRSSHRPDTINTLPEATIAAFEDHGNVARTIDDSAHYTNHLLERLEAVGIHMSDVGRM